MSADVILLELSIPHYLHVGASPPVIDSGRKKLQLQRGSVHDDALDMFLYTTLLTGPSLLHLTNITYVHNAQKYINVCLSVESSPKRWSREGRIADDVRTESNGRDIRRYSMIGSPRLLSHH